MGGAGSKQLLLLCENVLVAVDLFLDNKYLPLVGIFIEGYYPGPGTSLSNYNNNIHILYK